MTEQREASMGEVIQAAQRFAQRAGRPVVDGALAPATSAPAPTSTTPVVEAPAMPATPAVPAAAVTSPPAVPGRVAPRPARPLTPAEAGGRLRYVGSVAAAGARRAPVYAWDAVWDRVKLAVYREGQTHRGPVDDRHRQAYMDAVARRKAAVGRVVRGVLAPWTAWKARVGRVPVPAVTWGVTAGCAAAARWPEAPLLRAFAELNGVLAEAATTAGAVLGTAALYGGGAVLLAGLAYGVGTGIAVEHRARAALAAQRPAAPAPEQAGQVGVETLTAALVHAGVLREGQLVGLAGPVVQVPGGWRAEIILPPGYTVAMVRARIDRLASALSTTPAYLSIVDGATTAAFTLTRYTQLPFTGPPVAHPLLGGGPVDVLREGHPAGLDVEGRLVRVDLARGRHGLIVASSGNGKTQHLVSLAVTCALDPTAEIVLLDGKPAGDWDPLVPVLAAHVDTSMDDWLEQAADLLEAEVAGTRARQQRIRRGEAVGLRVLILDEFQMFTGSVASGGMQQGSPRRRIRDALAELSRLGRSARVGLVLATQSYDGRVVDDEVLANIGWRIVGYAPSAMSRAALGEHADRYGLDTSRMLVDAEQTGTAVVISPGIERYALARGWYQAPEALAGAVRRAVALREQAGTARPRAEAYRAAQQAAAIPLPSEEDEQPAQLSEEVRQFLAAAVAVYGEDDAEWVPTQAMVREVGVGELGWPAPPADDATEARRLQKLHEMRVATILKKAGVASTRKTIKGEKTTVVARLALLAAAGALPTDEGTPTPHTA